jgi:hypothetical protein
MPRNIGRLITSIEELNKKIEYALEDYNEPGDDILEPLADAIEALIQLNDELDSQLEDE